MTCSTKCLDMFDMVPAWGIFSKDRKPAFPLATFASKEVAEKILNTLGPDIAAQAEILPVVYAGVVHRCPHGDQRHLDVTMSGALVEVSLVDEGPKEPEKPRGPLQ